MTAPAPSPVRPRARQLSHYLWTWLLGRGWTSTAEVHKYGGDLGRSAQDTDRALEHLRLVRRLEQRETHEGVQWRRRSPIDPHSLAERLYRWLDGRGWCTPHEIYCWARSVGGGAGSADRALEQLQLLGMVEQRAARAGDWLKSSEYRRSP